MTYSIIFMINGANLMVKKVPIELASRILAGDLPDMGSITDINLIHAGDLLCQDGDEWHVVPCPIGATEHLFEAGSLPFSRVTLN